MTKILSINEVSMQTLIALTRNGDEIVLEENGKPIAKITPIEESEKTEPKERVLGLREGKAWTSEDFDAELPDEFWRSNRELKSRSSISTFYKDMFD